MLARSHTAPAPAAARTPVVVPRFARAGDFLQGAWGAPVFMVTATAHVAGLDLREGDLLVVGPDAEEGDLVMLAPRRFGRPMLGRMTRKGAVAEPGGVFCSPERWEVVGRLQLRVRPEPRARAQVLAFRSGDEAQQELLLLGGPNTQEGPCVLVRPEGAASVAVLNLLQQRLRGVERLESGALTGQGGQLADRAPMALAEAISAELWQRFRLSSRVVVAPSLFEAERLIERLPAGALAVAEHDLQLADAAPAVPAQAQAPRLRQLGLWG